MSLGFTPAGPITRGWSLGEMTRLWDAVALVTVFRWSRSQFMRPFFAQFMIACIGMLAVSTGTAQTTIPGSYAPFSVTLMKAGIAPAKGTTVLENGSVWYKTKKVVDGSGNTTSKPNSTAYVNRTTIGYVPDLEILGGDFYPAVFVMFMDQTLRTSSTGDKEF